MSSDDESYDSYEEDATRCEEDEDNSTDEENEVCSAFMGLQPYQYEPEKEKVVTHATCRSFKFISLEN